MRSGVVYPLPGSELLTGVRAYSFLLPTPSASPYGSNRGGAAGRVGRTRYGLDQLAQRGQLPLHPRGPLHPEYPEWMMGWPQGWTETERPAMASYQLWWQQHSAVLQSVLGK